MQMFNGKVLKMKLNLKIELFASNCWYRRE